MKEDHVCEQENESARPAPATEFMGFFLLLLYLPVYYKIMVDKAHCFCSQKDISEFPRHCQGGFL